MSVVPLHLAPYGRHKECEHFCSGPAWAGRPCREQCAKSEEFQADCAAEAQADRVRFARTFLPLRQVE